MKRTKFERPSELEVEDDREDLESLEQGLRIDENALEEALQQQADLFYRVSKNLALLISQRDAAKQEREYTEAKADSYLRDDARNSDDKITEKEIESRKKLDTSVIKVSDKYLRLAAEVKQWEALKEAYLQRGYALKELVVLFVRGYYGETEGRVDGSLREYNSTLAAQAREAIDRKRKGHL